MNEHLLEQIKEEFPDWEEWIGELWLQWPEVAAKRVRERSPAKRWAILVAECRRIRRAVNGEGRLSGLSYRETMDDLPAS